MHGHPPLGSIPAIGHVRGMAPHEQIFTYPPSLGGKSLISYYNVRSLTIKMLKKS